ncbi:MAG: MarR family winged helix-turn-helix transcriptional regulator [Patescibacteria group bacterium]|nr:MarR family winged helix-turn-helix transcriptional regulator [Patescibacteria group bacterium]
MKHILYNQVEEHRLGGWLVFTAMRLEMLADRFMFKPLGLTTASFRILMLLDKLGPKTPSEIIELIGSTKSNVTQRLNFLSRQGLINLKRKAGDDKRRVSAAITTLGLKQINAARRLFKKHNLRIENYFSPKEMQDFLRLIRKLNQGLDKCEININKHYEQEKA